MDTVTSRLFCESIEEAIDEVVKACGGRKAFACEMWPSLPVREAHNRLDACLNPERREKFSPHDLMYVLKRGRAAGCHSLMRYMAGDCAYSVEVIEPEDEATRLQREFLAGVEQFKVLGSRLDRIADVLSRSNVTSLAARRS